MFGDPQRLALCVRALAKREAEFDLAAFGVFYAAQRTRTSVEFLPEGQVHAEDMFWGLHRVLYSSHGRSRSPSSWRARSTCRSTRCCTAAWPGRGCLLLALSLAITRLGKVDAHLHRSDAVVAGREGVGLAPATLFLVVGASLAGALALPVARWIARQRPSGRRCESHHFFFRATDNMAQRRKRKATATEARLLEEGAVAALTTLSKQSVTQEQADHLIKETQTQGTSPISRGTQMLLAILHRRRRRVREALSRDRTNGDVL